MGKKRVKMTKEDADRIRILRQQYNANAQEKLAGMNQDQEYQDALNRIGMEIVMLEEKYGLYEEL